MSGYSVYTLFAVIPSSVQMSLALICTLGAGDCLCMYMESLFTLRQADEEIDVNFDRTVLSWGSFNLD